MQPETLERRRNPWMILAWRSRLVGIVLLRKLWTWNRGNCMAMPSFWWRTLWLRKMWNIVGQMSCVNCGSLCKGLSPLFVILLNQLYLQCMQRDIVYNARYAFRFKNHPQCIYIQKYERFYIQVKRFKREKNWEIASVIKRATTCR